ncbi:MAG: hypothetical protein PHE36_05365 [Novosphingobium sp.]|nr:hypothetical protein [Novosphingobium sp.]
MKRVFAPTARTEKAAIIEAEGGPEGRANALIDAIFTKSPDVEHDLFEQAAHHF